MTTRNRERFLCIFLVLWLSAFALSSQEPQGFPLETEWHYIVYEEEGNYTSKILIRQNEEENTWTFYTISPFYTLEITTTESMDLLESRGEYFEERFIQVSKARSFHIRRLSSGPYQSVRINKQGNEKRTITELNGALNLSMVKFKLLYLFHLAGTSFDLEMNLFDPGRQRPFRMVFTASQLTGKEIMTAYPDYNYPESFQDLLQSEEKMILVDGRLGGLPGTIYPHPFIYLMDQDFNLLADWGGKTEFPYYTFYQ